LTKVFDKFDKRVKIMRIDHDASNIKHHLMNFAPKIAKKNNLDWFIYLDADEFIILHNHFKGIKHFLKSYSYADSVGINWLMFGSNNFVNNPPGTIIENYDKSCKYLDRHVKSFVRTSEVTHCLNPHFYYIRNMNKMLNVEYKIMKSPQCFSDSIIPYDKSPAYIAHYIYQSEETYFNRKVKLVGDDGIQRPNMGKDIHKHYNDVINLQPQKYVKQIKEFLNYFD
jgi:hypothetical protein